MTIGFDARLYGLQHAGIGRYIENVVQRLIDTEHQLKLFLPSKIIEAQKDNLQRNNNVELIPADVSHYSLAEQTIFLKLLHSVAVDVMHFPHFNVPIFYNKPYVVTIHDILWHQVKGGNVTTLSGPKYYLKYFAYRYVVKNSVTKAKKIITPSQFVKDDLLKQFVNLDEKKIKVSWEGIDHVNTGHSELDSESPEAINSDGILNQVQDDTIPYPLNPKPYFLYVGSTYPHKNVPTILKALAEIKGSNISLKIVSSRNIFLERLEQEVRELDIENKVDFLGYVPDEKLKDLYKHATALIHPSLSEGFGFTGLEAMQHNCPVISSQCGSLPEVYDKAALYLDDPKNYELLANIMKDLPNNDVLRDMLIKNGKERVKQFTWKNHIKDTRRVYNRAISR